MEGAFDLMHYGHMNAFRLGASLGTHLIVGVNSGETIEQCKGTAPVMSDAERCDAVRGCRFVKEVVEKTPYIMTPEYLKWIMDTYKVDFVVHGDDPCLVDGKDVYAHPKAIGKYKSIPRTEGVSTTDIVGRMLLCNTEHHVKDNANSGSVSPRGTPNKASDKLAQGQFSSKFMTTSQVLRGFSQGMTAPPKGAKVVYCAGAWDMFHQGHVKILEEARKLGDFLIVGVLSDKMVNGFRGSNFPIMNLNERVLSVMGCSHVSDVLIDAPAELDEDMIASLNIQVVVAAVEHEDEKYTGEEDPFAYPVAKKLGVYKAISGKGLLQVTDVLTRIKTNRDTYEKKFADKLKKEKAYYDERYARGDKK